jgi:hypothetical protein
MQFTTLDNVLWVAGVVANAALLCVLLLRRRWRTFPVFTLYIAFDVTRTLALMLVYHYGSIEAYRVAYWGTSFTATALQLGWLYEIARDVLRPTGTWIRDARGQFLLWSGLGALIALAAAWAIRPVASSAVGTWEVKGFVFTSLLTCEIFLAMSVAANRLGLRWGNHVMALTIGLVPRAVTSVGCDIVYSAYGWTPYFAVLDHTRIFLYMAVEIYWAVTFWFPEQERAPVSPEMREYLVALHNRVQYDLDRLAVKKKTTP